jgi:hypothetical protein
MQDESEEKRVGGKMPKLTIMEEVLLLGLKDKQVSLISVVLKFTLTHTRAGLPVLLE